MRISTSGRARWGAVLVMTASAVALVACAGAPAASTAPSVAPSSAAPPSAEPTASTSVEPTASSAAGQELPVVAQDFAFELPASLPAGPTQVTLKNAGKEEHQAQVARINTGTSMADLTAALQNPDPSGALALISLVGGPTGVLPGGSGTVGVDLEPGTHVFLCFVSGADGIPHLAKGMIAPLEVTEPGSSAELPAGDAQLALQDFAFVGLDSLSAGPHTVTVTNKGPQPHEATIVKLAEGVTVQSLLATLTSGTPQTGPPPWTSAGGIAGIAPGASATMNVDLTAGDYAFVCFVPDPATGKAHLLLGMVGGLTVQ